MEPSEQSRVGLLSGMGILLGNGSFSGGSSQKVVVLPDVELLRLNPDCSPAHDQRGLEKLFTFGLLRLTA